MNENTVKMTTNIPKMSIFGEHPPPKFDVIWERLRKYSDKPNQMWDQVIRVSC